VEKTLEVTRHAARLIERAPHTELVMEPELSVVTFRRTGWSGSQYRAWSDAELASGTSFVVPTTWNGEVVLRLCIVNPLTSIDDIALIVDSLAAGATGVEVDGDADE
jgi:L-2,4-diaminobutyrate decarboxylase